MKHTKGLLYGFLGYKNSKTHFYPGMTGGIKVKRGLSFWIPGIQKLEYSFLTRNDKWNSRKQGFTLIELLVVIAIIALLSSVVMTSLSTARMKARDANRIASLNQVQKALEMYYDSKGYYPPVRTTSDQYMCPANTDCWDKNSWILSYTPDWQTSLGVALAPYLSKIPVDPINSNCWPFENTKACYSFAYGCVGKDSNPHTYDLVAVLETPAHSLSCKYQKSRWGVGYATMLGYTTGFAICSESGPPFASATYSSNIFHLP